MQNLAAHRSTFVKQLASRLAAIAAVSVIFGAKAMELEHRAAANAPAAQELHAAVGVKSGS